MGFGRLSIKKGPPLGKSLPGGGPFFVGQCQWEQEAAEKKKGALVTRLHLVTRCPDALPPRLAMNPLPRRQSRLKEAEPPGSAFPGRAWERGEMGTEGAEKWERASEKTEVITLS